MMLFLKGILIGIANIIPGVSGGTLAVVLGVYESLIMAINRFFSRQIDRTLLVFLFQIGGGAIVGILAFSHLITVLLERYNQATLFFFMGLILGSFPFILKSAGGIAITTSRLLMLVFGFSLVMVIDYLPEGANFLSHNITVELAIMLIISGVFAAGAMIVPGLSGSFILLVMGSYGLILKAVSNFYLDVLLYVALGAALGLVLTSRLIGYFLSHYSSQTYFFIMGLMLASLLQLWPGFSLNFWGVISLVAGGLGLKVTFLLGKK